MYGVQTVEGNATDEHVIEILRKYHLIPPPVRKYSISHTFYYDPSQGQAKVLREIFNDKQDGVFVECGAVDGVFLSNTLYLERALKWRGLLIEADKTNFKRLQSKNRNAYTSNTCLSLSNRAQVALFDSVQQSRDQVWWVKGIGKLTDPGDEGSGINKIPVQCFPFYSFMLALDMKTVDYFSLDVEGVELEILKTIPFDKIEIKVFSIEWWHHKHNQTDLDDFLRSKGYHEFKSKQTKLNHYEKIYIKDNVELGHLNANEEELLELI